VLGAVVKRIDALANEAVTALVDVPLSDRGRTWLLGAASVIAARLDGRMGNDPVAYEAAACGKIILLGEHAVVHGVPAIAAGIADGVIARVSESRTGKTGLEIDGVPAELSDADASQIQAALQALAASCGVSAPATVKLTVRLPVRAGLGSSAAMAVAIARALLGWEGAEATHERVAEAAASWERVFHGTPSGIDVAAAFLGGVIRFSLEQGARRVPLGAPLPMCVGLSGSRPSTRAMVDRVGRFAGRKTGLGDQIFAEIAELVRSAEAALEQGDLRTLGKLMDLNHTMLSSLTVSTDALDAMCEVARNAGALGAKLTGAGGGGCVIALAPDREQQVIEGWKRLGFEGFTLKVTE
jgi:mevalonate kinase